MTFNLHLALVAVAAISMTGCTTLGFGSKEAPALGEAVMGQAERDSVTVQRMDQEQPVLAKIDRDQWIEIRKNSKDERARLLATLGTREWEVAATEARAYLSQHPKDRAALMVLTTSLAMQKNYEMAAYYGDMLAKYYPGQADVLNIHGLTALHVPHGTIKDYRKALVAFEGSLQASETQIAAGLNLGHLYLEMGDAAKASATFATVRSRCADCTEATLGHGVAFMRLGKYSEARDAFSGILSKHPNHAQALYRLALVEKNGYNDNKKAESYLNQLLAKSSEGEKEVKRRANFMLRRIQAEANQAPMIANEPKHGSAKEIPEEIMNASFEDDEK